jgi:uncharacterized protein YjaG (DUF416 family)
VLTKQQSYGIITIESKKEVTTMYTQIDKTNDLFATLKKGTVLTKEQYEKFWSKDFRENKDKPNCTSLASWTRLLKEIKRFNVEKIEEFITVPTSSITTVDVLEMVRQGKSVEEIEKAIYTTVKIVKIKIK